MCGGGTRTLHAETAAWLQGDFAAAAIVRSPTESITEAVPAALVTTVQVVLARKCHRGDVVRVTLPRGAMRDSAGAALAPDVSAESICRGDSLQDVRAVHALLTAVGAVFILAALVGTVATGVLLWRVVRQGEGHYGTLQVGGATLGLLLLGARRTLRRFGDCPQTHCSICVTMRAVDRSMPCMPTYHSMKRVLRQDVRNNAHRPPGVCSILMPAHLGTCRRGRAFHDCDHPRVQHMYLCVSTALLRATTCDWQSH